MGDLRDIYDQAAAQHALMNRRQRAFGLARLEEADLSILERTLEVEVRVRNIVRTACAGGHVSDEDCFTAMAHLATLAHALQAHSHQLPESALTINDRPKGTNR